MNDGKVDWTGNFPAVISPFTKDGEIDEAMFKENVELLLSEGADGIIVSGSNGESWALRAEERLRLFKAAVDAADGRAPVLGGTGSIITEDVVELSTAAKDTGVGGVMIMPPYYAGAGKREVLAHFKAVSDGAQIPIMVYNSPKSTGINVTDYLDEMIEIEWIAAIKQSTLDFVEFQHTVSTWGDQLRVFTGHSAKRGLASAAAGAAGFVSSLDPHVMGEEAISLFRLGRAGDLEPARRIQARTQEMDRRLQAIAPGPAVMKAAMNLLGRPGGYPRRPLLPLSTEQLDRASAVLDDLDLLQRKSA